MLCRCWVLIAVMKLLVLWLWLLQRWQPSLLIVTGLLFTQWPCSRPPSPESRMQGVSIPAPTQQGQGDPSRQNSAVVAPFQRRTLLGPLLHCRWGVSSGRTSRENATKPIMFSMWCTLPLDQNLHDYPSHRQAFMCIRNVGEKTCCSSS